MNAYLALPLAQALLGLMLIPIVLKGHSRSVNHRLFSLYLAGLVAWGIFIFFMRSSPTLEQAHFWDKWAAAIGPALMVIVYHFSVCFTGIKIKKWLLPLAYAICSIFFILSITTSLVITGMQMKPYGYAPITGPLLLLMGMFGFTFFVMAAINLWRVFKKSPYTNQRNRSAYILAGLVASMVGTTFDALPLLGLPLYPGLIIGNITFCILTTVAIVKYHLLDIHVVLRKGLSYTLLSGLVAGIYGLVVLLISRVLDWQEVSLAFVVVVILAITIALLPMLRRVQRTVDKWFYRERYDHLKTLGQFSQETKDITDLGYLADSLIKLVSQAMQTAKSCLMLRDPKGRHFAVVSSYGLSKHFQFTLGTNSVLIHWLSQHGESLERRDLDILPQLQGITMKERNILNQVGAQLFVPMKTTRGLIGVLILGRKLSEEAYSEDDVKLLAVASHQIATALDNARLYKEVQEALRELQKTQDRLLRTERLRAVGEVAAGVGHDLRNLLTVTLGRAQLALERVQDNGKLKHDLKVIEQAALDGAEVVSRLQGFTKVGSDLSFDLVDMNRVLLDALQMVEPRLSQQREMENINTDVIVNLGEAELVKGKPSELREMLTNILANAIEAMPRGGKLTITSRQENDGVVISIEDTGVGIASKARKGIFESFYTTKGPQGVGLGLSIAHGVVKSHGGDIRVSSKLGKGSTFTVRLPVSKQRRARQAVSGKAHSVTRKTAALIIDDDKAVREVLSEILESDGYSVDLASNGKKGLAFAERKDYAVVMVDLGMPGMSGRDVAKAVNTVRPATPIFLVTGWDVQLQPAELIDWGVTGVITKPFTKTNVLAQIKRCYK